METGRTNGLDSIHVRWVRDGSRVRGKRFAKLAADSSPELVDATPAARAHDRSDVRSWARLDHWRERLDAASVLRCRACPPRRGPVTPAQRWRFEEIASLAVHHSERSYPPATAGRIVSSAPSFTGVSNPSRKRMSSPLR
jgi:hypothetical protein